MMIGLGFDAVLFVALTFRCFFVRSVSPGLCFFRVTSGEPALINIELIGVTRNPLSFVYDMNGARSCCYIDMFLRCCNRCADFINLSLLGLFIILS